MDDVWVRYLTEKERLWRCFNNRGGQSLPTMWARSNSRLPFARVIVWSKPERWYLKRAARYAPQYLQSYSWHVTLMDIGRRTWREYAPRLALLTPEELVRFQLMAELNQLSEFLTG